MTVRIKALKIDNKVIPVESIGCLTMTNEIHTLWSEWGERCHWQTSLS